MRRWMCSVFMTVGLLPLAAVANPFSALSMRPMSEIPVTGKIVATLQDGDYVLPRFSPDSRYLAFSHVVLQDRTELTEIQALDLKTRKVKMLLSAKDSIKFAIHKSFVTGFAWQDATTLKAGISDGDVNGVDLIFDVAAGKLVGKKPFSLTDNGPGRQDAPTPELEAAFSSIPGPVLANALANGFKVGDAQYLVQKNYWKQDNHVWFLDGERKTMTRLVEIPEEWIYSLRGGFVLGNSFILLMAFGQEAWLVRHASGKVELLHRFVVKNYQQTSLRVELARVDRVLFQVNTGPDYEKRENFLFVYDKSGIRKIRETAPIYDLNVNPTGTLVCLSQWSGQRRKLVVRELKEFH